MVIRFAMELRFLVGDFGGYVSLRFMRNLSRVRVLSVLCIFFSIYIVSE